MTLWWIGGAAMLVVVFPVVVALLSRLLNAIERIRAATDSILVGGLALVDELSTVPEQLELTDNTIKQVQVGAVRYAGSVAKLLG